MTPTHTSDTPVLKLNLKSHWENWRDCWKLFLPTRIQPFKTQTLKHTEVSQNFTGASLPAWAWCHYQQLKMSHETFPKAYYLTKLTIGYGELLQKNCVEWSSTRRRTVQARGQGRSPQSKWGLCLYASATATISHNARTFFSIMSFVFVCVCVCVCVWFQTAQCALL